MTCYSLKWRTCHTQFPLRVRLSHFAPLSGMWDVSMAVAPISCTTSVCILLVRWASPHIIPASCLLYCSKLLWNMRLALIWDVSWALLIWLCSAEPLTLPGIPHHGLPWICCGLHCVSSIAFRIREWCATSLAFLTWTDMKIGMMLKWGLEKTNRNVHQTLAWQ